ncbi:class A beta-lactamase [Cupriavidus laharis]|uniref:class A beta-lactamase n=1 Tax=Cupriavidus laharis TaxID=151654 RepID=UPI001CC3A9B0|nr:class A beta-lactamase [Cupriavidus laharis]
MVPSRSRRTLLLAAAAAPFASACAGPARVPTSDAEAQLAALERSAGGRLGVFARHTGDGRQVRHRAEERFPVCSTFKVILAGAILQRSAATPGLLEQRVRYTRQDLVAYSPITEKHVADGMTVAQLCAAAIQYSDNGAANLLMRRIGGPAAVTEFSRSIGNQAFRLDRWETELNTAIPGDPRDTSTPAAMAASLEALALGNALPAAQRSQLQAWLRGNTTGAARIQAGMPAGWQIGDKTGSGDYGTTNDIAVLWPPAGAPVVVAIYFTQTAPDAKWSNETIAKAARIVLPVLG